MNASQIRVLHTTLDEWLSQRSGLCTSLNILRNESGTVTAQWVTENELSSLLRLTLRCGMDGHMRIRAEGLEEIAKRLEAAMSQTASS